METFRRRKPPALFISSLSPFFLTRSSKPKSPLHTSTSYPYYYQHQTHHHARHFRPVSCTTSSDDSISSSSSSSPSPSSSSSPRITPSSPTDLKVGQVVAIQRSLSSISSTPELGVITGAASSGDTVDIQPLEPFIKELYVVSKRRDKTFEKAASVRAVPYEYASSQDAWIVLDEDLNEADMYFRSLSIDVIKNAKVSVTDTTNENNKTPLSPQAKQRQLFKPSKTQAFLASALSLPLAAILYAGFVGVSRIYQNNPQGEGLLNADFFRTFIKFVLVGSSVSSLAVGSALFLYALSKTDDDEESKSS